MARLTDIVINNHQQIEDTEHNKDIDLGLKGKVQHTQTRARYGRPSSQSRPCSAFHLLQQGSNSPIENVAYGLHKHRGVFLASFSSIVINHAFTLSRWADLERDPHPKSTVKPSNHSYIPIDLSQADQQTPYLSF